MFFRPRTMENGRDVSQELTTENTELTEKKIGMMGKKGGRIPRHGRAQSLG